MFRVGKAALYKLVRFAYQVIHDGLSSSSQPERFTGRKMAGALSNRTIHTRIGDLYFNPLGETRWELLLSYFDPEGQIKVCG